MTKQQFIVTLQADEPHPIEPAVRLRQALKVLGRAFSLKCIDIRETTAEKIEWEKRGANTEPTRSKQ